MDSPTSVDFDLRQRWGSREFGMKGARLYRLAAVCLGLLCVLLLIVITAVCIHYKGVVNNSTATLMALKAELQNNHSTVIADRDQLQTNYTAVVAERDQLRRNYAAVVAERDRLQNWLDTLTPPCPANWTEFNSSLYFVSKDQKTWSEGREYCVERGANLVIINTVEKQEFLNKLMKKTHFWIGLSDRHHENSWKWVDGTKLTSGFWKRGEPNDADKNEDCATSEPESDPRKNWNDMPCSSKRKWVCERPACH